MDTHCIVMHNSPECKQPKCPPMEEWIRNVLYPYKGFPGGSVVKNLPAMQKTQVQSLGWEDPLEREMATQCSILVWELPQTDEPGEAAVHEVTKSRTRLGD